MKNAKFTARSFDRTMLEGKIKTTRSCNSDSKRQQSRDAQASRFQLAPFNLQTESRGNNKQKETPKESEITKQSTFRARKMPSYKFFEVAKASTNGASKQP